LAAGGSGGDLITIAASIIVILTISALAASAVDSVSDSVRVLASGGDGVGAAGGGHGGVQVCGGNRVGGGLRLFGIPRLTGTLSSNRGRLNMMDLRAVATTWTIQRLPAARAIQTRTKSTMARARVTLR
jgi:hypothetical protein